MKGSPHETEKIVRLESLIGLNSQITGGKFNEKSNFERRNRHCI